MTQSSPETLRSRASWRGRTSSKPSPSSPERTTTRPICRSSPRVRRINPTLFIVARQNKPASTPLFATVDIDTLLEPTEVVAREVYAQLSMPLLRRFLGELPALGDAWASTGLPMTQRCGSQLQSPWKVRLTSDEAPAVFERIAGGNVVLGDLLRDPVDRDERQPCRCSFCEATRARWPHPTTSCWRG